MDRDIHYLKMAARLALRGHGGAEPNPMVGCVIVSPRGETVGWGYHHQCGGPHAEVVALRRAGERARGATLYCTLEPCDHTGRTPPCTKAIIDAGLARVVIARRDPNPIAACGVARLDRAGIRTQIIDQCEAAIAVSDPFAHRIRTGLPWVIAKWAQTIDGKIATRPPHHDSKWISNQASRAMVHRERGRVDAILTGIGTVLKDDPLLTARDVRVRRIARRIVIDPRLEMPAHAKLAATAHAVPTIIICAEAALAHRAEHLLQLKQCGVEVIGAPMQGDCLPMKPILADLVKRFDLTSVLVEAGTGLLSELFRQKLANEAWVFIAPTILGDEQARTAVAGVEVARITDSARLQLLSLRHRQGDIIARYRVRI